MDRVAYNQQKLVSRCPRGWKSKVRVAVWYGEDPRLGGWLHVVSSHCRRGDQALRGLFCVSSKLNHLSEVLPLNLIALGIRFLTFIWILQGHTHSGHSTALFFHCINSLEKHLDYTWLLPRSINRNIIAYSLILAIVTAIPLNLNIIGSTQLISCACETS